MPNDEFFSNLLVLGILVGNYKNNWKMNIRYCLNSILYVLHSCNIVQATLLYIIIMHYNTNIFILYLPTYENIGQTFVLYAGGVIGQCRMRTMCGIFIVYNTRPSFQVLVILLPISLIKWHKFHYYYAYEKLWWNLQNKLNIILRWCQKADLKNEIRGWAV